ncbi:alpha/beta-hydrolase [Aureobasidium pullulans]|uniref:Alpha/beta-hydrolase n=1 Tax=Aureobasidium pullulans TaxID=5580 RepID=A0AB74JSK1_AURPU|nr:alpha/beta-hydrolase [Aureobasidium pullulans]
MTTTAATTPIKADTPAPATSPPRPLLTRLHLWLRLWTLKLTIRTLLSTVRFFKIKGYGVLQPTYRKMYPIGARLTNEVWIPSSWKPGQSLPLYIDIHGGGFALGDPFHDDGWCNYLASKQNICVVSCDYRKSPGYFFPTQTNDLVEIITSILDDETLPVDKSKICIGGFSAGGNLSLSVAQDKQLQGKIKGLCLWYPSTDFSGKFKGIMRDGPDGSPDVLAKSGELFTYGYVPEGVDKTNPLLSPIYADRSILPEKMLFIGAEYDVLCNEALEAAKLFAASENAETVSGNVEEDDRQGVESWRKGGVWWEMVKGVQHGFNYIRKKEGGAERERERITEMAYDRAAAWLKREIYA